jgi:hypothetical protein
MTAHLSQVIAVEKDTKDKAAQELAKAQGLLSNKGLLSGIAKSYTPLAEDGLVLPPESTRVQVKATHAIKGVQARLVALFDVIATKDWTNCLARADIIVEGVVEPLVKGVPATYLLFLEKQCVELLAFVKKIPILDAAEVWNHDAAQGCWATPSAETIRSKKDKKSKIVFEGNQHHPPQFLVWDEDIPEGRWKTVHYSGAMPADDVNALVERIEKLQRAVKCAREEANRHEALQQHTGDPLLRYSSQGVAEGLIATERLKPT